MTKYVSIVLLSLNLNSCLLDLSVYYPSTVTLSDGKQIVGTTALIADYQFSFKDNLTGKVRHIKSIDVVSLTQTYKDGTGNYQTIGCEGNFILARVIETGELNLYRYQKRRQHTKIRTEKNSLPSTYQTIETEWYIRKRNEPCIKLPIHGIFKNKIEIRFMEFAQQYYADAPELLEKIGTEGYEYTDLLKTIREYNQIKNKQ